MTEKAMFQGRRFITRGVSSDVPQELQVKMWQMIEERIGEGIQMDYLQVFNLKIEVEGDKQRQVICHTQEIPAHQTEVTLEVDILFSGKIFVISSFDEENQETSTMMLACEY